MKPYSYSSICLLLSILVVAAGCARIPDRNPLPQELVDLATIPGIEHARIWADDPPAYGEAWMRVPREVLKERYPASFGKQHNYLAISGGGSNGAFAAGLLNGWTASGTRTEFAVVTGISTGALIAPFAFLGPEYDPVLKTVYTQFSTKDLLTPRSLLQTITGESATDPSPLREVIASYLDEDAMAAIAAEYRRGRTLLITTTNLDAGRPVSWNIGRIAASGAPLALDLIRDIMLASASIPAIFPPVLFEVEADGKAFDELHVDGGATSVVNLYPLDLDWGAVLERLEVSDRPNLYVIRNGRLETSYTEVSRSSLAIAGRSIDTMMSNLVKGDLYRLYLEAQRDGLAYHLAYIPTDFDVESNEAFDPEYMSALYDLAYRRAEGGYVWARVPPDYGDSDLGKDQ